MVRVELWTDGANSGPQKRGGWAAILLSEGGVKLSLSGYEECTTSNRMELTAVCEGLEAVGQERAEVVIHTDSSYVKNAFTRGWLEKWQSNGWRSYRGDAVANVDLWERLLAAASRHKVRWVKVRGHQNYELNNEADALAVAAKLRGAGEVVLA